MSSNLVIEQCFNSIVFLKGRVEFTVAFIRQRIEERIMWKTLSVSISTAIDSTAATEAGVRGFRLNVVCQLS